MDPAKTVRSAPQCFMPACGSVLGGDFGFALGFGLAFGFDFAVDFDFTAVFGFAFAAVTGLALETAVSFAAGAAPWPIAEWSTSVAGAADGAAAAWSA